MDLNSNLPVLVPAVVGLIVISAAALLALAWIKQPEARQLVRRAWIVMSVLLVGGVVIFWISTAMVEGSHRSAIDRSLQEKQEDELHQRLQNDGH
jgi:undecaprenyl pyrophosphate phosphatase UppP